MELWKAFPDTFAQKLSDGKWHPYPWLKYLSSRLTPALMAGGGRFLISVPPRHGKSEFISHWIPTWYLNLFPYKRIILSSYAASFAQEWGRRVRDNLEFFPLDVQVDQNKRAGNDFATFIDATRPERGGMKTAGVGGPITGRGADLFIVDDPIKNWEEAMSETTRETHKNWWKSTARTRLEPGASAIILQTRWHEDDLFGYLKDSNNVADGPLAEFKDKWEVINIPALAFDPSEPGADEDLPPDPLGREPNVALVPERYNENELQSIKADVGDTVWDALYQGNPTSLDGEIWKKSDWQFYDKEPAEFDEEIQSWDMTFKDLKDSDFVVCACMARKGADIYIRKIYRGQWGFSATIGQFATATRAFPNAFLKLIENKANGPAVEDMLRSKVTGIRLVEPTGSKIARATACEPVISSHHVYLPNPESEPWVKPFIKEAAKFPKGKHDDQVDAVSQGIIYLNKTINSSIFKLLGLSG